jgi:hypothetical protein
MGWPYNKTNIYHAVRRFPCTYTAMGRKWYVVTKGNYPAPDVFESWQVIPKLLFILYSIVTDSLPRLEVAPLVKGISGAVHQSYKTEAEARSQLKKAIERGQAECLGGAPPGHISTAPSSPTSPAGSLRPLTYTRSEPAVSVHARSESVNIWVQTSVSPGSPNDRRSARSPQASAPGTPSSGYSGVARSRSVIMTSPPTDITQYAELDVETMNRDDHSHARTHSVASASVLTYVPQSRHSPQASIPAPPPNAEPHLYTFTIPSDTPRRFEGNAAMLSPLQSPRITSPGLSPSVEQRQNTSDGRRSSPRTVSLCTCIQQQMSMCPCCHQELPTALPSPAVPTMRSPSFAYTVVPDPRSPLRGRAHALSGWASLICLRTGTS